MFRFCERKSVRRLPPVHELMQVKHFTKLFKDVFVLLAKKVANDFVPVVGREMRRDERSGGTTSMTRMGS